MTENKMPDRIWAYKYRLYNGLLNYEWFDCYNHDEAIEYVRADLVPAVTDLTKCPKCKGVADNGFDRCDPPNPYHCTKCETVTDDAKREALEKMNPIEQSAWKYIPKVTRDFTQSEYETIRACLQTTEKTDYELAKMFHETYECLAPSFGYETRKDSAKPWDEVPQQNKDLMVAVCKTIRAALQTPSDTISQKTIEQIHQELKNNCWPLVHQEGDFLAVGVRLDWLKKIAYSKVASNDTALRESHDRLLEALKSGQFTYLGGEYVYCVRPDKAEQAITEAEKLQEGK